MLGGLESTLSHRAFKVPASRLWGSPFLEVVTASVIIATTLTLTISITLTFTLTIAIAIAITVGLLIIYNRCYYYMLQTLAGCGFRRLWSAFSLRDLEPR